MANVTAVGERLGRRTDGDGASPSFEVLRTSEEIEAVQAEWEEFLEKDAGDHTVREQPFFLVKQLELESEKMTPFVVVLRNGGINCIAPFYMLRDQIPLNFGPVDVPTGSARVLRLFGEHLVHKKGTKVADNITQLLESLQEVAGEFDAIWLPEMEVPGEFWDFFDTSGGSRAGYRRIILNPNRETVQLINLPPSFDEYMAGFKSRDRSDRRRQLKKLEQGCNGNTSLSIFTQPDEIAAFFAQANAIRNESWKAAEFGRNRYDPTFVETHEAIARRGWMYGCILNCGDEPIAYCFGYPYNRTFVAKEWGFREDKRSLSPGIGMVLKMFQRFCDDDGGGRVLLGPTDNRMKRSLGNATYVVTSAVIVSNKSLKNRLRFGFHRFVALRHNSLSGFVKKIRARRANKKN